MNTSQKNLFQLSGLTIDRDRPILRDIDWEVNAGEHWVILGANGSGKTALLRALTGYFTPTSGSVRMFPGDEEDLWEWNEIRKKIGFVSNNVAHRLEEDEPALETVISGRYAMINYWAQRTPRADRNRAREILAQVECAHLEKQPWHQLSQGEKQRVLIGRALMVEDLRILILDEPCAGLDPVARERFLAFLERFVSTAGESRERPVLLMVTHHVEEIVCGFTHALLLRSGEVMASGPIETGLSSALLSSAFDCPVTLRKRKGRYALSVERRAGFVPLAGD